MNESQKVQCDGYDGNAYETHFCSFIWKLEINDKVKFQMDGYGANDYTNSYYTYIEGFLAVALD